MLDLFLKNLQADCLQFYLKDSNTGVFPWSLQTFEEQLFLQNTSGACFCTSGGCFCIFFKKELNSYFATLIWYANNFFFSTHHLHSIAAVVLFNHGTSPSNFRGDIKISDQNNWGLEGGGDSYQCLLVFIPMMPWLLC